MTRGAPVLVNSSLGLKEINRKKDYKGLVGLYK
jgi:hypothetical protein